MPLQFVCASEQFMQFLDLEAKIQVPLNARELEPNHRYSVLMFLQNTDSVEYESVAVAAWHDTFEIGLRGLSSLIIQPVPVDVPAQQDGVPGIAIVRFVFMSPSAGRGRLAAKVVSPSGPSAFQQVQICSSPAPYLSAGASASSGMNIQE